MFARDNQQIMLEKHALAKQNDMQSTVVETREKVHAMGEALAAHTALASEIGEVQKERDAEIMLLRKEQEEEREAAEKLLRREREGARREVSELKSMVMDSRREVSELTNMVMLLCKKQDIQLQE
jgi:hypothetical protein